MCFCHYDTDNIREAGCVVTRDKDDLKFQRNGKPDRIDELYTADQLRQAKVEVLRAEENRTATVTKMKDGEEGITFGFKLQQVVVDEEGGNSAVVEYTQAVAKQKKGRAGQGHVQKVVRQAVIDTHEQDGRAPNVEDVLTEAVKHMPYDKAADGAKDRRRDIAFKALESLIAMGELVSEKGKIKNVGVEYPDSQNSAGDVGDLA